MLRLRAAAFTCDVRPLAFSRPSLACRPPLGASPATSILRLAGVRRSAHSSSSRLAEHLLGLVALVAEDESARSDLPDELKLALDRHTPEVLLRYAFRLVASSRQGAEELVDLAPVVAAASNRVAVDTQALDLVPVHGLLIPLDPLRRRARRATAYTPKSTDKSLDYIASHLPVDEKWPGSTGAEGVEDPRLERTALHQRRRNGRESDTSTAPPGFSCLRVVRCASRRSGPDRSACRISRSTAARCVPASASPKRAGRASPAREPRPDTYAASLPPGGRRTLETAAPRIEVLDRTSSLAPTPADAPCRLCSLTTSADPSGDACGGRTCSSPCHRARRDTRDTTSRS